MAVRDFDYILDSIVGGGGWWQWQKCLFLIPQYLTNGLPLLLHMFTAYTPEHRCYIDGCDNSSSSPDPFDETFLHFTTPKDAARGSFLSDSDAYDPCQMFVGRATNASTTTSEDTCSSDLFSQTTTNCSRFVYDDSEFSETLTTRLDLVCSRVGMRHFLGSVMMVGLTMGSFLGGPIGDRFGRKKAMFCGMVVVVPSVVLGGFVDDYFSYIALRLLSCTCIVFSWIAGHNFQLEYFSKTKRKTAYAVNNVIGHSTAYALPLIIYFFRDWRLMHVAVGVVAGMAFPTYFVIPESARWLACNDRSKEAEQILLEVAKKNGRTVSQKQRVAMRQILKRTAEESRFLHKDDNLGICDMFGRPLIRRTLVLFCCWICSMVSLYALMLNVGALSGDIFINFIISISCDIPAHFSVFFIVDRFGRRRCLFGTLFGLGVSCLTMAAIPKESRALVLAVYLPGKFFAALSASMVWLFTAELYPTNLRSQALGTCSMISRIFGTTSSFIPELARLWTPLPMVALGVPAVISACLALTLPETKGKPLPQTLEEALTIGIGDGGASRDVDLKKLSMGLRILPQDEDQFDLDDEEDSSSDGEDEELFLELEREKLLTT